MAAESGADDLWPQAEELCLELVERFDPDAPLGYRGEAQTWTVPHAKVDDPALLDGAAGPTLVLLGAATTIDPGWDRAMLLS